MAYQKLQVSRTLTVIPSDNTLIPFPGAKYLESTTTGNAANKLIDATVGIDFIALGVEPGDIIYNYDSSEAATVTAVDSATELSITLAGGITSGDDYILFKKDQNNGCVFYIGTATAGQAVEVVTSGGDTQIIPNVVQGSYQPVSIKQVKSSNTTASDIIALW